MKRLLLAAVLAATALPAAAGDGRWTRAEVDGDLEFFIDKDNMRFFLACPTKTGQADLAAAVTLHFNDMSEVDAFTVSVGEARIQGPVSAEGEDGVRRFRELLAALRLGDAVVRYGETTLRLPKANAAEALPDPAALPCNLKP